MQFGNCGNSGMFTSMLTADVLTNMPPNSLNLIPGWAFL